MLIAIIVDDDGNDYNLISKAVQEIRGCVTFHAGSSRCFFKLIKKSVPDFIFLKAVMPGRDAMYCLKKLRADRKYNAVPVIAYASSEDHKKEAYKNRADFYISELGSYDEVNVAVSAVYNIIVGTKTKRSVAG